MLPDGTPVMGGIASPGNSPFAITVGTINTWGTVSRADDTVASYSSRGPTQYDLAVKPDLAAPGNKIISLEAPGSYLAAAYPTEHVAGSGNNAYFRMSGTSMSTPMVSAGAALLLQASPHMTAAQVKFLLQTGSTYMTDGGLILASGAGQRELLVVAADPGPAAACRLSGRSSAACSINRAARRSGTAAR